MVIVGLNAWLTLLMPVIVLLIVVAVLATISKVPVRRFIALDDGPLFRQPLLWIVLLLPTSYALIFGCVVWKDFTLEVSAEGIARFFDISKHSIFILSPSIPLAILVSRMHASLQTKHQIDESQKVNSYNAYFSHVNHFCGSLRDVIEKNNALPVAVMHAYSLYFPNNSINRIDFHIGNAGVRHLEEIRWQVTKLVDYCEEGPETPEKIANVNSKLSRILSFFGARIGDDNYFVPRGNATKGMTAHDLARAKKMNKETFREFTSLANNCFRFIVQFAPPDEPNLQEELFSLDDRDIIIKKIDDWVSARIIE